MPIYEYQCQQCQHQFDEIQKVDAAPLTDCPSCAESALVKLLSAPSFRLKGGGWYETDFKKDKRKNLAGEAESGKSGNETATKGGDASTAGTKDSAKSDKATAPVKAEKSSKAASAD